MSKHIDWCNLRKGLGGREGGNEEDEKTAPPSKALEEKKKSWKRVKRGPPTLPVPARGIKPR